MNNIFARECPMCGTQHYKTLPVSQEQYDSWLTGSLIQDAMPHLSLDDREFLMTGFCKPCDSKLFSIKEEE